jgi:hypothetical protein
MEELNIKSLRNKLWESMHGVSDGSLSLGQARLVGELAGVVLKSVEVEHDVIKTMVQNDVPDLSISKFLGNQILEENDNRLPEVLEAPKLSLSGEEINE